jgi:hypothetical protein
MIVPLTTNVNNNFSTIFQQFFSPLTPLNCTPFPSTEWENPGVRGVEKKGTGAVSRAERKGCLSVGRSLNHNFESYASKKEAEYLT